MASLNYVRLDLGNIFLYGYVKVRFNVGYQYLTLPNIFLNYHQNPVEHILQVTGVPTITCIEIEISFFSQFKIVRYLCFARSGKAAWCKYFW